MSEDAVEEYNPEVESDVTEPVNEEPVRTYNWRLLDAEKRKQLFYERIIDIESDMYRLSLSKSEQEVLGQPTDITEKSIELFAIRIDKLIQDHAEPGF